MRSVTPMRAAKIGYIVMSALFCLLGIALLFTPDASALWIGHESSAKCCAWAQHRHRI